jgi:hypothetical protein
MTRMRVPAFRARAGLVLTACLAALAVLAGTLATPAGAANPAPNPFFGTWSDGMSVIAQNGNAASTARLDDVSGSGVGLVRQYIWWDRIETSPGTYDWAVLDELVKEATARGVGILPTLLYTPSFYQSKPDGAKYIWPPADPQTMARFATALVKRYGTHGTYWKCTNFPVAGWSCPEPYRPIQMWEVWNEPDLGAWWKGAPSATDYLDLLKAVHDAVKAADPQAKIVLGSMTNRAAQDDGFLAQLYALGAKNYFDYLSLNAYARDVGSMMAFVKAVRGIAAANGDAAKPLVVTEWGWATDGGSSYIVADEGCQAALLYNGARQLYARRGASDLNLVAAIHFQWQDAMEPSQGGSWPNYAGVRRYAANNQIGAAKPGLAALQAGIAGQPAPAGVSLDNCTADRRSLDGDLQRMTVSTQGGTGTGTVSAVALEGLDCGADCHQDWQPGQQVVLQAVPSAGSTFAGWRGAPCTGTPCSVTMDKPYDITAVFSAAPGVGTYQESSPYVSKVGTWVRKTNSADRGGASAVAVNGPASAQLTFYGQGVRWLARTGPTGGKNAVFIDGVRVATVDRYTASPRYAVVVFASRTLPLGEHTIRIVHTGTRNAAATDDDLSLDAFVVR